MKKNKLFILALFLFIILAALTGCDNEIRGATGTDIYVEYYTDNVLYKKIKTTTPALSLPEAPEKEGYDFDGWYWDNEIWAYPLSLQSLKNKVDEGEKSLRVYAKWYKSDNVSGIEESIIFSKAEYLTPEAEKDEAYFERLEYEENFILRITLNDKNEIVQDISQIEINSVKYRKTEKNIKNFRRDGKIVSADVLLKYDATKIFKLNSVIIVDELDIKKYANIYNGKTITDLSEIVIDNYFEYNTPTRNALIEEIKKLNNKKEYTITRDGTVISANLNSQRMSYKDRETSYKQIGTERYSENAEFGKIKTESAFQPLGTNSVSGFTGNIDELLSEIIVIKTEGKGTKYIFDVRGETKKALLGTDVVGEVVYSVDIYTTGAEISIRTENGLDLFSVDFSFTDFKIEDDYFWLAPTKDAVFSYEYLNILNRVPKNYTFSNYSSTGKFITKEEQQEFEFSCFNELKADNFVPTAKILLEGENYDYVNRALRDKTGYLQVVEYNDLFKFSKYAPSPIHLYDDVMLSATLQNEKYTVFFKTSEFNEILSLWDIKDAAEIVNAYEEIVFNTDNTICSDIFVVYKNEYNDCIKIHRSAVYTFIENSLDIKDAKSFIVYVQFCEPSGVKINKSTDCEPHNFAATIGNKIYVAYGKYIVSVNIDDGTYEILPIYGTNLRSFADRYLSYKNGSFIYFYDVTEKTLVRRIYVGEIYDYIVMEEGLYCLTRGNLLFKSINGSEKNLTLGYFPEDGVYINASDSYFIVSIEDEHDSYANWNKGRHYVIKNGELLHIFEGFLESFNESRITVSETNYSAKTFEEIEFPVLKMVETDYYGETKIISLGVYGENDDYIITKNGFYDKTTEINSIITGWKYYTLSDVYYLEDGRIIINDRDTTDIYNIGSLIVVGATGGIKNIDVLLPSIPYAEADENDVFSIADYNLNTNAKYKIIGNNLFIHYYETERTPLFLQRMDVLTKQVIWDVQLPCDYYPGYIKNMFTEENSLYVIYSDGLYNGTYTGYKLDLTTGNLDDNFTVTGLLIGIYNDYKIVKSNNIISVIDDNNQTVYSYSPKNFDNNFYTKIYENKLYISYQNEYNSNSTGIVIDLATMTLVTEKTYLPYGFTVDNSIIVNGKIFSGNYVFDTESLGIIEYIYENFLFVRDNYLYTDKGIYDINTLRKVYNFPMNTVYDFSSLIVVGDKVYVAKRGQNSTYYRLVLPE